MTKSVPKSFDNILSIDEQCTWFDNPHSINELVFERALSHERRLESESRLVDLEKFDDLDILIQLLRQYVQNCIPAFRRTESVWWILSCLPKTTINRLCAISINWMETFVVFRDPNKDRIGTGFMIVSETVFRKVYPNDTEFYKLYSDTELERSSYKVAEDDQLCLHMNSVYALIAVLQNPTVLLASRELNLRLMNRGKTPYTKYHSFALADYCVD